MKNFLNKKNVFILTSLIIVFIVGFTFLSKNVQAKDEAEKDTVHSCSGSSGNIYGYIDTENVGPIYLSKESWEEATGKTTTEEFYVELNHSNPTNLEWSGKGWNESVGWVDFSYNQVDDIARFVEPGEEHDGGCDDGSCDKWGGWNGEADLSSLVYSTENGSIIGTGIDRHGDTGGDTSEEEDDYIGSGEWTFSHVQFQDPPCPQDVNLFIGGKKYWYKNECPADINIPLQWNSENVHGCKSVGASSFWENTDRDTENTGTSVKANGTVTSENSPVIFKLSCVGDFTNTSVDSIVTASCGEGNDPCGEDGEDCINIISPILIEA
jgi:hypothetical protein